MSRCASKLSAAGRNAGAVEALRRLADGVSRTPVWIFGPPGCGKSHLLAGGLRAGGRRGAHDGLAAARQLCARRDPRCSTASSDSTWSHSTTSMRSRATARLGSRAVHALQRRSSSSGGRLAIARPRAPAATAIRLPDLASRLAASEVHRLEPLAEAEQRGGTAAPRRTPRPRAARRDARLPDAPRAAGFRDAVPHARCARHRIAGGTAPPDRAVRARLARARRGLTSGTRQSTRSAATGSRRTPRTRARASVRAQGRAGGLARYSVTASASSRRERQRRRAQARAVRRASESGQWQQQRQRRRAAVVVQPIRGADERPGRRRTAASSEPGCDRRAARIPRRGRSCLRLRAATPTVATRAPSACASVRSASVSARRSPSRTTRLAP